MQTESILIYQAIAFACGLAVVLFGAVVGLLAKNQMSAGLLSMPFMVILMAPMFIEIMGNETVKKIARLLPTDAMATMFAGVTQNEYTFDTMGSPALVIAGWFVISAILFALLYKKVGVDN